MIMMTEPAFISWLLHWDSWKTLPSEAGITASPSCPAPAQLLTAPALATSTLLSYPPSLPPVPPTPKSSCCRWRIKKKKIKIIIIIKNNQWTHFLGFTENLLGTAQMSGSPCKRRSAGGSCILLSSDCIKNIWGLSCAPCIFLSI